MAAATPTPGQYQTGACKQDMDSLAVAVRVKAGLAGEWAIMTVDRGGRFGSYDDVESWTDMQPVPAAKKVAARRKKT